MIVFNFCAALLIFKIINPHSSASLVVENQPQLNISIAPLKITELSNLNQITINQYQIEITKQIINNNANLLGQPKLYTQLAQITKQPKILPLNKQQSQNQKISLLSNINNSLTQKQQSQNQKISLLSNINNSLIQKQPVNHWSQFSSEIKEIKTLNSAFQKENPINQIINTYNKKIALNITNNLKIAKTVNSLLPNEYVKSIENLPQNQKKILLNKTIKQEINNINNINNKTKVKNIKNKLSQANTKNILKKIKQGKYNKFSQTKNKEYAKIAKGMFAKQTEIKRKIDYKSIVKTRNPNLIDARIVSALSPGKIYEMEVKEALFDSRFRLGLGFNNNVKKNSNYDGKIILDYQKRLSFNQNESKESLVQKYLNNNNFSAYYANFKVNISPISNEATKINNSYYLSNNQLVQVKASLQKAFTPEKFGSIGVSASYNKIKYLDENKNNTDNANIIRAGISLGFEQKIKEWWLSLDYTYYFDDIIKLKNNLNEIDNIELKQHQISLSLLVPLTSLVNDKF